MAQFFTEWEEYELDEQPDGWTRDHNTTSFTVIESSIPAEGRVLEIAGPGTVIEPSVLVWTDGPQAETQEVIIYAPRAAEAWAGGNFLGVSLRWQLMPDKAGYMVVITGGQLKFYVYVPAWNMLLEIQSESLDFSAGPVWIRARIEDWVLMGKAWPASGSEPSGWTMTRNLTLSEQVSSSGYAGIAGRTQSPVVLVISDGWGYGTDGDPAPLEPPGPPGDVTITPPSINAAATALVPAIVVPRSAMISVPVIGASAAALAPSVQTGRRADVAAPLAAASALALAPVVTAVRRVDVEAPAVYAAARAFAPAVTTERAATVRPPLVDASASVLPPIVSTGRFASVSVPLVQASADALAPDVVAERHVTVRTAMAEVVAQVLPPTVDVSGTVTIRPPAAGAAAEIMRPVVTAVRQVATLVPLIEAEAEALRPDVHTGAIVRVEAPTVRARAEALAPGVSASRQVRVLVPVLSATAEALAPTIALHVDLPSVIVIRLTPSRSLAALISSGQTTARIRRGFG